MCSRCVKFCPASRKNRPVIYIGRNRKAMVVEDLCTGCGRCVRICPEKAIEMRFIPDPIPETAPAATDTAAVGATATGTETAQSKQTAPSASPQHVPEPEAPKRKETPEEALARKKKEYVTVVIRTGIALALGVIAGIVSFYMVGTLISDPTAPPNWILGVLICLVAIVIQKTIFLLIKIDTKKLGKKDWFYQGFMTFCAWFISWTMLLSASILPLSA